MQLARPCRSIVNLRSTGNHSSSLGTKVAHHDMHSWTRSAPLKMLDCQAAISGKRLAVLRFYFLGFCFLFLSASVPPASLPPAEYPCFFCVLIVASDSTLTPNGLCRGSAGFRKSFNCVTERVSSGVFLSPNKSTDKSFDVRKALDLEQCALQSVYFLSVRLKWWFCCSLTEIIRFVSDIWHIICHVCERHKVKEVVGWENSNILKANPVKLFFFCTTVMLPLNTDF